MLRRQLLAIGAALALVAAVPVKAAEKELVVACDTAFVPFEFKQGDKYVGFDIDLWNEIAKDIGVKYKLQPMDFNGIVPGLQTRNIDVALAGITIREDRKKVIDFSDPYYESGLLAMVSANNKTINTVKDLDGKIIAAKTGTATADYLKANVKSKELRLFPNIDNAYLELRTGRVDAAVHDTPNVLYYVNTAGKGAVRVVSQSVKGGDFYGIGFPKGSPLVPKVNAALKKIKADGRYDAIYKKWFGTAPKA